MFRLPLVFGTEPRAMPRNPFSGPMLPGSIAGSRMTPTRLRSDLLRTLMSLVATLAAYTWSVPTTGAERLPPNPGPRSARATQAPVSGSNL